MLMIVFYLAEDRESGKIIDDGYSMTRPSDQSPMTGEWVPDDSSWNWIAEKSVRRLCEDWNFELIDWDGPFWSPLWRLGLRRPKWENQPPPGIAPDKWAQRLKSTGELNAYRAGVLAGSKSKSRRGTTSR
jgi:hypothetical protein